MATRISNGIATMRKRPQQERSRATTEALLDAAAQVLGRRGWSGFTTAEVVDVAGASIGSLYQYFPNGLAIVTALRERHLVGVLDVLHAARDPYASTRVWVVALVGLHARVPAAHRALLEDVPRESSFAESARRFRLAYDGAWDALLDVRSPGLEASRRRTIARLLSGAVAGAIHDAAERGELGSETFRDDVIRFVDDHLDDPIRTRPSSGLGVIDVP